MAFGNNPTTTTQPTLPTDQIPLSSVAVPNAASGNLTALEGGPASTDSNGNAIAPASIYIKDGSNVTQGAKADAAVTDHTLSASEIALLKGLLKTMVADGVKLVQSNVQSDYDTGAGTQTTTMFGMALPASGGAVAGGTSSNPLRMDPTGTTTQPVSGTVTANAGTNLNTSSLALESGGNLAASKTDLDSILAGIGAIGDAAWSLSGNASEIAILKKLALLLQSVAYDNNNEVKTSLYGKATSAGDTPVLLDNTGRLLVKAQRETVVLYSTTLTGVTTTGNSGSLDVSKYSEILLIWNITSFSGTSVTFRNRAIDEFGNNVSINASSALSATGASSLSAGTGIQGGSLGKNYMLEWQISSATVSAQLTVYAK